MLTCVRNEPSYRRSTLNTPSVGAIPSILLKAAITAFYIPLVNTISLSPYFHTPTRKSALIKFANSITLFFVHVIEFTLVFRGASQRATHINPLTTSTAIEVYCMRLRINEALIVQTQVSSTCTTNLLQHRITRGLRRRCRHHVK